LPTRQKDVDLIILDVISRNPGISLGKINKEVGKRGVIISPRNLSNHLRKLLDQRAIRRMASQNDKTVGYVDAHKYVEWEGQRFEERKIHSDELKKVIRSWIDEFPRVTWSEKNPDAIILRTAFVGSAYRGRKLGIEEVLLFSDLRNHLEETTFEKWEGLKLTAKLVDEAIVAGQLEHARALMKKFDFESAEVLKGLEKALLTPILPGICEFITK